jgi:D-alanyl-D-alanine dipeptidase
VAISSLSIIIQLMVLLLAALSALTTPSRALEKLPADFVRLKEIDPSIIQDIRFAGAHNVLGRPAAGYEGGECVLTRKAAKALALVQAALKPRSLSLKVYDCFRPERATEDLARWGKEKEDGSTKTEFYPHLEKSEIFASGYILPVHSSHSRGSAVDLTLVSLPTRKPEPGIAKACTEPAWKRPSDGSFDMGTSFDCFDPLSNSGNPGIQGLQKANRQILIDAMGRGGFQNMSLEWWHFSLKDEPFPNQYFNFTIR